MGIKNVTTADVRRMNGTEALIIQGCGGDLQEWADGINDQLTEAGILRHGSRIENCFTFTNDGITCLGFSLDDADADLGKLVMWRLQTHETFGGTWLTDYVDNKLNGFIQETVKPKCPIIGADGNIFNIIGMAAKTLKGSDMAEESKEMCSRVTSSGSYEEALGIIMEYVEPCSEEEMYEESEEIGMNIG